MHHRGGDQLEGEGVEVEEDDQPLLGGASVGGGSTSAPPSSGTPSRERVDSSRWSHKLPPNPSLLQLLLFLPLSLLCFWRRLSDNFGWRFVLITTAVYGLSQGLGEELMGMASLYYYKDIQKLEPSDSEIYSTISHLPWDIKTLYGCVSDSLPILGYHRTGYIFLAGLMGVASWGALAAIPMAAATSAGAFFFANLSIASPDVMIDAAVAERCQSHPLLAADLQSLCWGALSVGGILGCTIVGPLETSFGPQALFALAMMTSAAVLGPSALGWLGEARSHMRGCHFKPASAENVQLFALAVAVAVLSSMMAAAALLTSDKTILGATTLVVASTIVVSTYIVLSRISPVIAKPAIFMFLRGALQPNLGAVTSYWYTDFEGGPKLSPSFLGAMDCVAYGSMLVGIAVYNRYMTNMKYRTTFTCAQLLLLGAGALDFILYTRINLALGIPDRLFVLGEEAILPLVAKFYTIPMFVLATRICPPGVEASLFALLMSLSNLGGDVGSYFGILIIKVLGLTRENYSMLPFTVVIKSLSKLVIILLIYILVPDASPSDPLLSDEDGEDGRGGRSKSKSGASVEMAQMDPTSTIV